jgi:hypothetical protein
MYCSPHFFHSHHIRANFPNYKGPDPRYKWIEKSLTCNNHVGFKALCNKHVGFKALVISKSFSSLLIGCVRRPTSRTDKGSSRTDNMITFNDISVYNISNFKFKRYSLYNQSIICRKVLFSMYYVIFRWATGGIKFWESAIASITY